MRQRKIEKPSTRQVFVRVISLLLVLLLLPFPTVFAETQTNSIARIVSEMTTEQKISQMIMPAFRKYTDETGSHNMTVLTEDVSNLLKRYGFAGVTLFTENIADNEQTTRLIDSMQSTNASVAGRPQLFIATDQEGGTVTRLTKGTQMPGNMALGAIGDATAASQAAEIIGKECLNLGINFDFAPVLDVNSNPRNPIIGLRSFSDAPLVAAQQGVAYMNALQATGEISAVKHFPGHGNTETDSHTGLPCVNLTYEELKATELVPFKACIDAGVDAVMTAHIQYPKVETTMVKSTKTGEDIFLPATLSKIILTDILRGDMGFNGLIITDAMEMRAIAEHFGALDAAARAINAGADILLMPMDTSTPQGLAALESYISGLVSMVSNKTIQEEKVDAAVTRILTLKSQKGLLKAYNGSELDNRILAASAYVGSRANHEVEWNLAKRSITLLKNDNNVLPIRDLQKNKTVVLTMYNNEVLSMQYAIGRLCDEGRLTSDEADNIAVYSTYGKYSRDGVSANDEAAIMEWVADAKHVICVTETGNASQLNPDSYNATSKYYAFLDRLIDAIHKKDGDVTILSCSLPYDVARFQKADAIVLTWSAKGMSEDPRSKETNLTQYGPNMPAALFLAFSPDESPKGALPVNILKLTDSYDFSNDILYPRGYGLQFDNTPSVEESSNVRVEISNYQFGTNDYTPPKVIGIEHNPYDVTYYYNTVGWNSNNEQEWLSYSAPYGLHPGKYYVYAVIDRDDESPITTGRTEFEVNKGVRKHDVNAYVREGATQVELDLTDDIMLNYDGVTLTDEAVSGCTIGDIAGNGITLTTSNYNLSKDGVLTADISKANITTSDKGKFNVILQNKDYCIQVTVTVEVLNAPMVIYDGYMYGYDYLGAPKVVGNTIQNPVINFFYTDDANNTTQGTAWSNLTPTTLTPGKHYVYATITNSEDASVITTGTTEFEVEKHLSQIWSTVIVARDRDTVTVNLSKVLEEETLDSEYTLVLDGEMAPKVQDGASFIASDFSLNKNNRLTFSFHLVESEINRGTITLFLTGATSTLEVEIEIYIFTVPNVEAWDSLYHSTDVYTPYLTGVPIDSEDATYYVFNADQIDEFSTWAASARDAEFGTRWSSEYIRTLEIGTYYVYAVIASGENYPETVTEATPIRIWKLNNFFASRDDYTVSVSVPRGATTLSVDLSRYLPSESFALSDEYEEEYGNLIQSDNDTISVSTPTFNSTTNVLSVALTGTGNSLHTAHFGVFFESEHYIYLLMFNLSVQPDIPTPQQPSSDDSSDSSDDSSDSGAQTSSSTSADGSKTESSTTTRSSRNADGSATLTTTETVSTTAKDGSKAETKTESTTTSKTSNGVTTETTKSTETMTSTALDGTQTVTVTNEEKVIYATKDSNGNIGGTGTLSSTAITTLADGSKTTTVTQGTIQVSTDSMGTVNTVIDARSSTTDSKGNVTVLETVTTESVAKDGSIGEVVVDKSSGDLLSANVSMSKEAVDEARKTNSPVQAPVTIPVSTQTAETATPISVRGIGDYSESKPASRRTEVEFQTTNSGYGVVAFVISADGSREIVKGCRMGSVIVPVAGDCQLVIVDNKKPFYDVLQNTWYESYIDFVSARSILNGVSDHMFAPETSMSRAMVAQMLYNYNRTSTEGIHPAYNDVSNSDWYADAVGWASKNRIISGYSATWFGAKDAITRQDLVTILYRYANMVGYKTAFKSSIDQWADAYEVADYAKDAIDWALDYKLIDGVDGTLSPTSCATRAQVAAIMTRFVNNVNEYIF